MDRDLERVAGLREIRTADSSMQMAVGTLACPDCDVPVFLGPRPMAPADPLSCPFCGRAGRLRQFLSLGEPTRPTRVVVRVSGLPVRP
jgi:uncharacterized Zn-finger protein